MGGVHSSHPGIGANLPAEGAGSGHLASLVGRGRGIAGDLPAHLGISRRGGRSGGGYRRMFRLWRPVLFSKEFCRHLLLGPGHFLGGPRCYLAVGRGGIGRGKRCPTDGLHLDDGFLWGRFVAQINVYPATDGIGVAIRPTLVTETGSAAGVATGHGQMGLLVRTDFPVTLAQVTQLFEIPATELQPGIDPASFGNGLFSLHLFVLASGTSLFS